MPVSPNTELTHNPPITRRTHVSLPRLTYNSAAHECPTLTHIRGCDEEAIAKNQAIANSIGPARFATQHHQWFRTARELHSSAESPLLHIYSEELTGSLIRCNGTMARVYSFLQLPPLPDNCDMAKVPQEWPCDIQADPQCSMEKYKKGGEGGVLLGGSAAS